MDHRCAYGHRCRDKVTVDRLKLGAVIEDPRGLCRRCHAMVRGALRSIGEDWAKLDAAVGDHLTTGEVHVSGTREPPMPLNGTVLALRSTLSEWCEAALWMVAEPLGIDVRQRHKAKGWPVKDGPVIAQAARILPEQLKLLFDAQQQPVSMWSPGSSTWYTEDLDGIDVAIKLTDLHHEVNSVLGQTNPRIRLSLPCPGFDCGARTLGVDNGSTDITCLSCGRTWTQADYDWVAGLLITDEQDKEAEMLKWLLAEAQWWSEVLAWCVAERDWTLYELGRLSRMTPADLQGIDGVAVVELVRELIDH